MRIIGTNWFSVSPLKVVFDRVVLGAAFGVAVTVATLGVCSASPVVHPGDTLGITVANYDAVIDSSGERLKALSAGNVVVASDGSVSIPVINTIHVSGKSTDEIARLIERRLNAYVRDPSVTVRLLEQNQQLFLTGATIGTLPYLPGETLSSALGQLRQQLEKNLGVISASDKNGGTLSRSALDLRAIVIERDRRKSAPVDGERLIRAGIPGPALSPGDTLMFANKPVLVDVRGQVNVPGPIYLYPDETLEQALLLAGGPLSSASTVDAGLIRDGAETPLPLGSAALRGMAQSGDVIVVRAAPHVTVIGQVPNPGEFELKNGSTLLGALYVAGGPTKWANVRDVQVVHSGTRQGYDLSNLTHGDLSTNVPLVDGDVVFVPEGHRIDPTLFFQAIGSAIGLSHL